MKAKSVDVQQKFFVVLLGLIVSGASLLGTSLALAGTEGHGGDGVLCQDLKTGTTTVELLDFWTGRNHGIDLPVSNDVGVDELLQRAVAKMEVSAHSQREFLSDIKYIMKKAKYVDVDKFPVPHDTGTIILPANCRLVGIVNYKDRMFRNPLVTVNSRIYNLLSNTDKAGLWFHEKIFSFCRDASYFSRDSSFTQRLIAITFSSERYDTPKWPRLKEH